jgi:hypothetical protein
MTSNSKRYPGYSVSDVDGTIKIVRSPYARSYALLIAGLFWTGGSSYTFAGHTTGTFETWGVRLFAGVFVLVGLYIIYEGLVAAFGIEEWELGPNRLHVKSCLFGRCREKALHDCVIHVYPNDDGFYRISIVSAGDKPRYRAGYSTRRSEDQHQLSNILERSTGWQVVMMEN